VSGVLQALLASGVTKSLAFEESRADTTSQSTYTFAAVDIGAASSSRHVIVTVGVSDDSDTGTISSATIGGIAATVVVQAQSGNGDSLAAVLIAPVPTGTTATVVINLTQTADECVIGSYSAGGVSTTALDTDSDTGSSGVTDTMGAVTGGFCVGIITGEDTSPIDINWSPPMTEDFQTQGTTPGGVDIVASGASGATTSPTVSITAGASGMNSCVGAFATW
jgi:hypothetical protein